MAIIKKFSPEFLMIIFLTLLVPLVTFQQLKAAFHISDWLNTLIFLVYFVFVSVVNYHWNKEMAPRQILNRRLMLLIYFVIYLVILRSLTSYLNMKNVLSGTFFWVILSIIFVFALAAWMNFRKKIQGRV